MTFTSMEELEKYIIERSKDAIIKSQAQIFQVIDKYVKQYYAEFSPEVYERTYQLYRSLVKTKIEPDGKGWKAHVYFDLDALDYAMKKVNGKMRPNSGWSEEKTLEAAAHGSHGGYVDGTAIWDTPLGYLKDNHGAYDILRKNLISSGIPIK